MLADQPLDGPIGELGANVQKPKEWLLSLVDFIANALPSWRDDPTRPARQGEDALSAQLCSYLNSATYQSGWDFLQFRREEPDEKKSGRAIDLVAAPKGVVINVEGREYTMYQTLLPIECKRLPTPKGAKRDAREYLYSQYSSTGGVARFKAGHHGAEHAQAIMIGYVQAPDILAWFAQINAWVNGLVTSGTVGWSAADVLALVSHDQLQRLGRLTSTHMRSGVSTPIGLSHLWIEM